MTRNNKAPGQFPGIDQGTPQPQATGFDELFPAASYQYVWLGMGGHVGQAPEEVANRPSGELAALDRVLHDVQRRSAELVRAMPSNRELLRTLAETQPGESMVAS